MKAFRMLLIVIVMGAAGDCTISTVILRRGPQAPAHTRSLAIAFQSFFKTVMQHQWCLVCHAQLLHLQ